MKLIDKNDLVLTTPTQKFDFSNPPFEPIQFAKDLVKFMYDSNGIGLAANQVGVPYAIFSMRGTPENFVCFNPRIVDTSSETVTLDEGCLTFPGFYVKIERPRHIKVRFNTPNGDIMTKKFTGMTARIFQHEMEHMQGKKFTQDISSLKIEMAIKKARKLGYNYYLKDFK